MQNNPPNFQRTNLQKTVLKTFQNQIQDLNPTYQNILADDLITTFFNRLNTLKKIQQNTQKGN